jgi:hypothetical protein
MARLRAGRSGLQIPTGAKELPLFHNAHMGSGSHPPSNSISTGTPSKGLKKPGLKSDRSPPSSVEVRNEWRQTSSTAICLHGLSKNSFTLPYTFYTMAVFNHVYFNIRNMNVLQERLFPSVSPSLIVRHPELGVNTASDLARTWAKTFYDHPYVH